MNPDAQGTNAWRLGDLSKKHRRQYKSDQVKNKKSIKRAKRKAQKKARKRQR